MMGARCLLPFFFGAGCLPKQPPSQLHSGSQSNPRSSHFIESHFTISPTPFVVLRHSFDSLRIFLKLSFALFLQGVNART